MWLRRFHPALSQHWHMNQKGAGFCVTCLIQTEPGQSHAGDGRTAAGSCTAKVNNTGFWPRHGQTAGFCIHAVHTSATAREAPTLTMRRQSNIGARCHKIAHQLCSGSRGSGQEGRSCASCGVHCHECSLLPQPLSLHTVHHGAA